MFKSVIPNILVSIGYILILLGISRPFLEWQIRDLVTDFPSTYKVNVSSNSLKTRLGEALQQTKDLGRVDVINGETSCFLNLRFDGMRARDGEELEQALAKYFSNKNITSLVGWVLAGFYLSIIYIWLFTIFYKRPVWEAAVFTVLAGFIFILLTQIVRPFLWTIGSTFDHFEGIPCYPGSATFTIALSKIHYETLIALLAGIVAELVACIMMIQSIMNWIVERIKTTK